MRTLCLLVPIEPGARGRLAAELARLPQGADSPLGALPGLHLARFVLIPALEARDGAAAEPPEPHLLFCADADGPPEALLDALVVRLPELCSSVWRHCRGWPAGGDAAAVRAFLARHRLRPGFTLAPYAGATVDDVHGALELRTRVADFAAASAGLPANELARAWRATFGGGA